MCSDRISGISKFRRAVLTSPQLQPKNNKAAITVTGDRLVLVPATSNDGTTVKVAVPARDDPPGTQGVAKLDVILEVFIDLSSMKRSILR